MKKPVQHWPGQSLAAVMATVLSMACVSEAPVGPNLESARPATVSSRVDLVPDLGICGNLQVPKGSTLVYHVYAKGVQLYRWNGSSWSFIGPVADLFADPEGKSVVGSHSGGPTWETLSGAKVVAAVAERCTADASAVQWLLLDAVSTEGPGVFDQVKHIQRLNTVGGIAPSYSGSAGEEVGVPYTTEYFFYRAR